MRDVRGLSSFVCTCTSRGVLSLFRMGRSSGSGLWNAITASAIIASAFARRSASSAILGLLSSFSSAHTRAATSTSGGAPQLVGGLTCRTTAGSNIGWACTAFTAACTSARERGAQARPLKSNGSSRCHSAHALT